MTLTAHDLAVREKRIGASEVAAVLGISPYADATPFAVWARIVHGITRADAPELTAGTYLERAVADWYQDQHPEVYQRADLQRGIVHPAHDWLSATPDRVLVEDGPEPCAPFLLECKTDRNRDAWGEPGTDQVPVHIAAQVQIQMACLGMQRCDVAVLWKSLDQFAAFTVLRDDAVIEHIIRECGAWYAKHVTGGSMPDLDGGNAAAAYLRQRYPSNNGAMVTPTEAQAALVAEYRAAKTLERARRDAAGVLRQRLILEIAEHDGFTLQDGGWVSFRADKRGRRSLRMSGQEDE